MVLVTVVGKLQCKEGFEFAFKGPVAECKECKVRNVCFHLDENRRYRVVQMRNVEHECRIHEEGVRVVEVERVPTRVALPSRVALEGSMLSLEPRECMNVSCPNYRLCRPLDGVKGMRFKITSVEPKELECPIGERLKVVLLE
jgi:uncharacterized protein (UPF0179 family)